MWFNNLKATLRNLRRQWGYALLNGLGLAIGIAASLIIVLYVTYERSYDRFHADADRIYRVRFDLSNDGEPLFQAATTYPALGPTLAAERPEVEAAARLFLRYGGVVVRHGENHFKEDHVFFADSTALTVFSYPMTQGDRQTALDAPYTAVMSEALARKYFGNENPVGQRIEIGADETYTVTGVVQSPENSHLTFDLLLSFPTMTAEGMPLEQYAWNWYDFYTYVRLRPGTDPGTVEAAIPDLLANNKGPTAVETHDLSLQPLTSIHLHSDLIQEARPNGDATTIYVLGLIAIFILLIAWINYVNLATARAIERAQEVGVRKALGAGRWQLASRFLLEALVLNALAVGVAFILVRVTWPTFATWAGIPPTAPTWTTLPLIATVGSVLVAGALGSGLYPALVLAGYEPTMVLRGTFATSSRGGRLRRGLVVLQFAASVGLVAGTIVVYQQLEHLRSWDLGFDPEEMMIVEAPRTMEHEPGYVQRIESFRQEVRRHPGVEQVTASTEIPGNLIYWASDMRRQEGGPEARTVLYQVGVDDAFLDTYDHHLIAGRSLDPSQPADTGRVVLNQTAVRALGFSGPESALGQSLVGGPDSLEIVGVVADFHQQGVDKVITSTGFRTLPSDQTYTYFTVKAPPDNRSAIRAHAQATFVQFFPDDPFNAYALSDFFNRQYRTYDRFGQVVGLFALLAILVATLGLVGLAAFAATRRAKEIGVRKVLGATVSNVVVLLSKDFLKLVLLGSFLATPVVWIGMEQWLQDFAQRIPISGTAFVLATVFGIVVALLAVSTQAWRAAQADPAAVLRSE